jgi:hypothetical protein
MILEQITIIIIIAMKVKKRMNIEKYPIYFNLLIIKTGSKIKRIIAEYAC